MLKVLVVVVLLAVVTYALVRVIDRRGVQPVRRPAPRPPVRRPVSPDDDEDFLRDLSRRRRQSGDPDGPG